MINSESKFDRRVRDVHYWKDRFVESDQMVKKLSAENGALRERIDDLIAGDVMHEPNWSN